MKGFWLSSVAAVALVSAASSALAADMSRPPPPVISAPLMPVYSWTGFYIGANLGGAWASGTLSDNVTGGSVSASHSGFIGGGQLGYNWQWGNFVLGGEWLFDGTDLNASGTAGNFSASAHTDWVSTATARFGWSFGNWLWYGKAGGAWVQNSATATFLNPVTGIVTTASGSRTNSGWTVGTGLEWAFTPNWIGRLEYDYIGLDNWNVNSVFNQFSINRQINMFTAGLSYKF
jgi:outer membrane immunogenic protein